MFADREEAGRQLAIVVKQFLDEKKVLLDQTLVASIPRGGVVVGKEVATELEVPHEVIIAKKLRMPGQPELAMGAMAENGEPHWHEPLFTYYRVGEREKGAEVRRVRREIKGLTELLRVGRKLKVEGKTIVLVDDGIATGETMRAAAEWVKARGGEVIIAVPVGARNTIETFRRQGYVVLAVLEPADLRAIGQYYREFGQVDEKEVRRLLSDNA